MLHHITLTRAARGAAVALVATLVLPAGAASALDAGAPTLDRSGDAVADPGVLRVLDNGDMEWIWRLPDGRMDTARWGNVDRGDIALVGDFDGDGRDDPAVYRPGRPSTFFILGSTAGQMSMQWGEEALGDVPLHGDFNGDGRADIGVMRPRGNANEWYIVGQPMIRWGSYQLGDVAVPADYDGDGRTDIAIRRYERDGTTRFYIRRSTTGGMDTAHWGDWDDETVQGDYDGDGRADVAVVRWLGNGNYRWFVRLSSGGQSVFDWGAHALDDYLLWGDFTGNGRTEAGVWRPSSPAAHFFIRRADGQLIDYAWGDGDRDYPMSVDYQLLLNLERLP